MSDSFEGPTFSGKVLNDYDSGDNSPPPSDFLAPPVNLAGNPMDYGMAPWDEGPMVISGGETPRDARVGEFSGHQWQVHLSGEELSRAFVHPGSKLVRRALEFEEEVLVEGVGSYDTPLGDLPTFSASSDKALYLKYEYGSAGLPVRVSVVDGPQGLPPIEFSVGAGGTRYPTASHRPLAYFGSSFGILTVATTYTNTALIEETVCVSGMPVRLPIPL